MIPNPYYFIDDLRFIQIKKIYIFYNKYIYIYININIKEI
jgi:hypothetical protein